MIQILPQLLTGLFGLGGKFIEDKDKKNEFAFKVLEMAHEISLKLLDMKTYPWLDALVKLAYASNQIIKGLLRPIFSAGLFIYGLMNPEQLVYLHNELGAVGDLGIGGMFGAFPGWMVSRHKEKAKKAKTKSVFDDEDEEFY